MTKNNGSIFNYLLFAFLFGIALILPVKAQTSCEDNSFDKTKPRELPKFIYGVTAENASDDNNRKKIIKTLRKLCVNGQKPFIRIVFQNCEDPGNYREAVKEIRKAAFIVGEILDSQAVKKYSVEEYKKRAETFVSEFGHLVDIWEIGNEINEHWLRPTDFGEADKITIERESKKVIDKIIAAYKSVKRINGRTALTLYFNDDGKNHCWELDNDEMFHWTGRVPLEMKQGLDYVWISYYDDEDDCRTKEGEKLQPDWKKTFARLETIFTNPKLQLGFGEIGTHDDDEKLNYVRKYYGGEISKEINNPKFTGGYFWWYFEEQMLVDNNNQEPELLKALIKSIQNRGR